MTAQDLLILKIVGAVWGAVALIIFCGSLHHEIDSEGSDALTAFGNSVGRAIFWPIVGAFYLLASCV